MNPIAQLCSLLFGPSNDLLFFPAKVCLQILGPHSLSITANTGFNTGLQLTTIIYLVLLPD